MNVKKFFKIIALMLSISLVVLAGVYASQFFMSGGLATDGPNAIEKIEDKRINILFMATDADGWNTDTMMLACFDSKREALTVLSIPRDTRVKIGNRYDKINAAYANGKKDEEQEMSITAVKEITGLPIHYYIVVNPKAVIEIIDILGGVQFDVPDVEGKGRGMNYEDPTQKLYIHLKPGPQLLDGKKAHDFLRYRSGYPNADLGRIEAQQNFLKALFEQKARPEYLLKVGDIYDKAMKNINTNVQLEDANTLIPLIKLVKGENMKTFQIPGEAKTINSGSYYIFDPVETKKLIDTEVLGIEPSPAPSASPGKN